MNYWCKDCDFNNNGWCKKYHRQKLKEVTDCTDKRIDGRPVDNPARPKIKQKSGIETLAIYRYRGINKDNIVVENISTDQELERVNYLDDPHQFFELIAKYNELGYDTRSADIPHGYIIMSKEVKNALSIDLY